MNYDCGACQLSYESAVVFTTCFRCSAPIQARTTGGPVVGQRIKCPVTIAGSSWIGVVTATGRDGFGYTIERMVTGSTTEELPLSGNWAKLSEWQTPGGIYPDTVVAVVPKCCSKCQRPNEYDTPANRGDEWVCMGCKLWESVT